MIDFFPIQPSLPYKRNYKFSSSYSQTLTLLYLGFSLMLFVILYLNVVSTNLDSMSYIEMNESKQEVKVNPNKLFFVFTFNGTIMQYTDLQQNDVKVTANYNSINWEKRKEVLLKPCHYYDSDFSKILPGLCLKEEIELEKDVYGTNYLSLDISYCDSSQKLTPLCLLKFASNNFEVHLNYLSLINNKIESKTFGKVRVKPLNKHYMDYEVESVISLKERGIMQRISKRDNNKYNFTLLNTAVFHSIVNQTNLENKEEVENNPEPKPKSSDNTKNSPGQKPNEKDDKNNKDTKVNKDNKDNKDSSNRIYDNKNLIDEDKLEEEYYFSDVMASKFYLKDFNIQNQLMLKSKEKKTKTLDEHFTALTLRFSGKVTEICHTFSNKLYLFISFFIAIEVTAYFLLKSLGEYLNLKEYEATLMNQLYDFTKKENLTGNDKHKIHDIGEVSNEDSDKDNDNMENQIPTTKSKYNKKTFLKNFFDSDLDIPTVDKLPISNIQANNFNNLKNQVKERKLSQIDQINNNPFKKEKKSFKNRGLKVWESVQDVINENQIENNKASNLNKTLILNLNKENIDNNIGSFTSTKKKQKINVIQQDQKRIRFSDSESNTDENYNNNNNNTNKENPTKSLNLSSKNSTWKKCYGVDNEKFGNLKKEFSYPDYSLNFNSSTNVQEYFSNILKENNNKKENKEEPLYSFVKVSNNNFDESNKYIIDSSDIEDRDTNKWKNLRNNICNKIDCENLSNKQVLTKDINDSNDLFNLGSSLPYPTNCMTVEDLNNLQANKKQEIDYFHETENTESNLLSSSSYNNNTLIVYDNNLLNNKSTTKETCLVIATHEENKENKANTNKGIFSNISSFFNSLVYKSTNLSCCNNTKVDQFDENISDCFSYKNFDDKQEVNNNNNNVNFSSSLYIDTTVKKDNEEVQDKVTEDNNKPKKNTFVNNCIILNKELLKTDDDDIINSNKINPINNNFDCRCKNSSSCKSNKHNENNPPIKEATNSKNKKIDKISISKKLNNNLFSKPNNISKITGFDLICNLCSYKSIRKTDCLKALKQFNEEIDISKLIKAKNELQLIKYLLFDRDQINILNNITKEKKTLDITYDNKSNNNKLLEISSVLVNNEILNAPNILTSLRKLEESDEIFNLNSLIYSKAKSDIVMNDKLNPNPLLGTNGNHPSNTNLKDSVNKKLLTMYKLTTRNNLTAVK